jgi:hypothetical protein
MIGFLVVAFYSPFFLCEFELFFVSFGFEVVFFVSYFSGILLPTISFSLLFSGLLLLLVLSMLSQISYFGFGFWIEQVLLYPLLQIHHQSFTQVPKFLFCF